VFCLHVLQQQKASAASRRSTFPDGRACLGVSRLCNACCIYIYVSVFVHPCVSFRSNIAAPFQIVTHCSLITSSVHCGPLTCCFFGSLPLAQSPTLSALQLLALPITFTLPAHFSLVFCTKFVCSLYFFCCKFSSWQHCSFNTEFSFSLSLNSGSKSELLKGDIL
jgi:hypothetical protein